MAASHPDPISTGPEFIPCRCLLGGANYLQKEAAGIVRMIHSRDTVCCVHALLLVG